MPDLFVFVPVAEVFPEVTADFDTLSSLIGSLSRTDTLFWCARTNLALSNPAQADHVRTQERLILQFFDQKEIDRLNRFTRGRQRGAREVAVFHRPQLLELIRWTALLGHDHKDDGNTFEDPATRRRFLQAALIAGDMWAQWVYQERVRDTGDPTEDRRRAITAFKQGVSSNVSSVEIMNVLARGVSLYQSSFRSRFRTADEDFHSAAGMSLDQYMACLAMIAINFTKGAAEDPDRGPGIFRLVQLADGLPTEAGQCLIRFVERESQTADELRSALSPGETAGQRVPPFDYKPLRDRPILRTPGGRAIVLDPVFFSERAAVGPLFSIASLLERMDRHKEVNAAFGAFGFAFEEYVTSILRSMYPAPSSHLADRLTCNAQETTPQGRVEIADAILLDVSEAVIFEAKAAFVRDETLHDASPDAYFAALRKKSNTIRFKCFASAELADRAIRVLDATGRMMFPGMGIGDT